MRESELTSLLLSLFDPGELRRFIRYRYPSIESWLPGPTASAAALAFEAVQALQPGQGSSIPYALRQLHGLVLPEVGIGGASDQLLRLVRQLRTSA